MFHASAASVREGKTSNIQSIMVYSSLAVSLNDMSRTHSRKFAVFRLVLGSTASVAILSL